MVEPQTCLDCSGEGVVSLGDYGHTCDLCEGTGKLHYWTCVGCEKEFDGSTDQPASDERIRGERVFWCERCPVPGCLGKVEGECDACEGKRCGEHWTGRIETSGGEGRFCNTGPDEGGVGFRRAFCDETDCEVLDRAIAKGGK